MATLELTNVDKRYGAVQALQDAHLWINEGEILGLLGPNGSGKSTLNKVLTGAVKPDRASLKIDGIPVAINSPRDAYRHRIAAVYQQLSLVPYLTVAENLTLGVEETRGGFLRKRAQRQEAAEMLDLLAPGLEPVTLNTKVAGLLPGTKQLLEVGKALLRRPRFLVLDEATASLRKDQVELVFDLVREQTAQGVAVVFVSHRMEEVINLCDRVTIIRNGTNVADIAIADTSEREIVRLMVGDEVAAQQRAQSNAQRDAVPAVAVDNLCATGVHGVTFSVQPGEVLGLGGLQGQGQSDLLLALFGVNKITSGTVLISGTPVVLQNPRAAVGQRIALVPGDRAADGFYADRSIQENISTATLPRRAIGGVALGMPRERKVANDQVDALAIKIGSLSHPVSSLSGGNAQKVVVAKWLAANPQVVLLDDPTKGVDVGAKSEIYAIIRALTSEGVAVILNTSDDLELTELADRVLVMYEGRIVRELVGGQITNDNLVAAALLVDSPQTESEPVQ